MTTLLLVEDDLDVQRLVTRYAAREGIEVTSETTATAGVLAAETRIFDVAIIDVGLPDGSGLDVLRALDTAQSSTHIIMMSGASGEEDRVRALQSGADDYVVKPFLVRELTARVLAAGRRRVVARNRVLHFGALSIDLTNRHVCLNDSPVNLTSKEYDLLAFLSTHPCRVYSRAELLQSVWGSAPTWQGASTVTEHIRRLRIKIKGRSGGPSLLRTVRSAGYSFEPTGVA
ncbi:MAG: two-component system, OmpR family, response regulator [Actinomycetota bacterium]|jgi:DNA-binding response OmpR family regulator